MIDADNGISLLESTFKDFKKLSFEDKILPKFFNYVNQIIDSIHESMAKGRNINEIIRILESESSIIVIYYHPLSRVLFCTISDADDDTEKIKEIITKLGKRFWKKHRPDLRLFRSTTNKSSFLAFQADLENLTMGGRVAESFPRLLVIQNVLEKVFSMGIINDVEYKIALECTGSNSPLKISKIFNKNRYEIAEVLKKLEQLDLITY